MNRLHFFAIYKKSELSFLIENSKLNVCIVVTCMFRFTELAGRRASLCRRMFPCHSLYMYVDIRHTLTFLQRKFVLYLLVLEVLAPSFLFVEVQFRYT